MALDQNTKAIILKYNPNFNFNLPRSGLEMKSIAKAAWKREFETRLMEKLKKLAEQGYVPGAVLQGTDGEREVLKKLSSKGELVLVGRRGGFNAEFWKVVG